MTTPPPGPAWLVSHPLVIGVLGGALAGHPSLGLIAGVAMTPLLSERDDAEVAAAATFGAVLVAGHLSDARGMGGILNESWIASTLGLVTLLIPILLLGQLHTTVIGRTMKAAITLLFVVAVGWIVRLPSSAWGLAPWIAGALFTIGLGRLAGSPADPGTSVRRLATVLALLATNVLGSAAILVLPVAWFLGERLRPQEPSGRGAQGATAVGALITAFLLGWLPYQLPAWDQSRLQLPSGDVIVELSQTVIVLPLFGLGAAAYYAWGRATEE